jgi:hypothetical protein
MSELKEMATTLWTQLLEGLRTDGLIAHCVVQSGPATSKVIVETCQLLMTQSAKDGPWLDAAMKPEPGRVVIGITADGALVAVKWSAELESWLHSHDGSGVNVVKWRFVELPSC